MTPLPIDASLPEIVSSLRTTPNLVIEASPGAGKTTRVPRALLDSGIEGQIVILEPRRLAARLAANRVAHELQEEVGLRVGYQVRLEERTSAQTRIRFITEGILTRQLLSQPTLPGVSVVILDEFHERHIASDVSLAMLRRLQATSRPDLRIVVMSATLHSEALSAYLGGAPIVRVAARRFAIETTHLSMPDERPIEQQVYSMLSRVLTTHNKGDVLIFLPGTAEIRRSIRACESLRAKHQLELLPLYGDLSPEEQDRAVNPGSSRKAIFSTNVAETSVTIEGVTVVIDSGLARVASYSAWSGLPTLRLSKIAKAASIQRQGRAGRTQDGFCYRLFTQHDFDTRPAFETPELLRLDLAETVLLLHGLSQQNTAKLWLDEPPVQNWQSAESLLISLGALDEQKRLTPLGQQMLRFPLHPRLSRIALFANERGLPEDGLRLAALLSEQERSPVHIDDPILFLEKLEQRNLSQEENFLRVTVEKLVKQFRAYTKSTGAKPNPREHEKILYQALMVGFPDRVARLKRIPNVHNRGEYEVVFSIGGSAAFRGEIVPPIPEYVVALDVENRVSSKGAAAVVRTVCAIELDWIMELFFDLLQETTETKYNHNTHRVETTRRLFYQNLLLEEEAIKGADPTQQRQALLDAIRAVGITTLGGAALTSFRAKAALIRTHKGEEAFPLVTDEAIQEMLPNLLEGVEGLSSLQESKLVHRVLDSLSYEQQRLYQDLPEKITLPGGRKAPIEYEDGVGPSISSRLQDFFGMKQGPTLFAGRLPLVLRLLAPNGRDVQVTTDLAGFWKNHYPTIAKELRRKYPRHSWPDDPLTAEPPIRKG